MVREVEKTSASLITVVGSSTRALAFRLVVALKVVDCLGGASSPGGMLMFPSAPLVTMLPPVSFVV